MRALIVEHAEHEGAGIVGAELVVGGVALDVRRMWAGDPLPASAGYDLVLVLGGPMSAGDDAAHPHLAAEAALLAESSRAGRLTVGICLGAQLLARALGARVVRGPAPEIGLYPITLTDAGKGAPLLDGLDGATLFHWHSDTFDLPVGAVRLASSARYANQAFRAGARTFGVQFHPECDRAMRVDWAERGLDELRAAGVDPRSLAGDDVSDAVAAHGRRFARALLQLVGVRE
ncbi:MAG: glutamine amidotransferase class-I [Myxococcales bacterium]|nr:glutamine amidotransferase class-I [Myxococcales bacterium]